MLRIVLLSIACALFMVNLNAQISEGGIPYSTTLYSLKSTSSIPAINLEKLDVETLRNEEVHGYLPCRFGIYKDTLIDLKARAKVDIISGKGRIWRLEIRNENAFSLQVNFDRFIMPEGASLFVYNENMTSIAGAFTSKNMRNDLSFAIADFGGNHLILEYFEPDHAAIESELIISSIAQAYKDPFNSENRTLDFVNVNCPVGKDAQLIKHAVCRMTFRSGDGESFCSGALINNIKQDETPYFLTANHCISTNFEASSLITYFNYEVVACSGDMANYKTLTGGATLLTTGPSSDFTLLQLKDIVPDSYQPYYAGWNVKDSADIYVTSVHVPYMETKKISIDYDSIISYPFEVKWDDESVSPINTHWLVGFDIGKSVGGSSGGPLFNRRNQIIGQLHGGGDDYKFYGKLSYSHNSKYKNYPTLRSFLDPDSTGALSLGGLIPEGISPDAFFTAESDLVCMNTPIRLQDYSAFSPYKRKWIITPATFSFVEGTSDTSARPVVEFHENSLYTVKLELSVAGLVKASKSMAIKAGNEIAVNITSWAPDEICDCDFDSIQLVGVGGSSYYWELPSDVDEILALNKYTGDTVYVSRKPGYKADANYNIDVRVTGIKGTCTATGQFEKLVLKPSNDDISNAIVLNFGKSDEYTNICATTEEGEPVPPITSCTSQLSWCDECMNGTGILQNSVWFKLIPDEDTKISISSMGFDNQIALYDAESPEDLLKGNFILMAANDDRLASNPYPLIRTQSVTAGKTYWIQVDGSHCGDVDDFNISITNLATGILKTESENLEIYPQPASEFIVLKGEGLSGFEVEIAVYGISGQLVCKRNAAVINGEIKLDVSFLEPGMYLLNLSTDTKLFISRMIKY